jgi:hypothetical protein
LWNIALNHSAAPFTPSLELPCVCCICGHLNNCYPRNAYLGHSCPSDVKAIRQNTSGVPRHWRFIPRLPYVICHTHIHTPSSIWLLWSFVALEKT